MKVRKTLTNALVGAASKMMPSTLPQIPDPADSPTVQAAKAMYTAITQGMPAPLFCRLCNTMAADHTAAVARLSLDQLRTSLHEDPEAQAILVNIPRFDDWLTDFHQTARELYPADAGARGQGPGARQKCETCNGTGVLEAALSELKCPDCNGSGAAA